MIQTFRTSLSSRVAVAFMAIAMTASALPVQAQDHRGGYSRQPVHHYHDNRGYGGGYRGGYHDDRRGGDGGGIVAGVVLGAVVGAAIAGSNRPPPAVVYSSQPPPPPPGVVYDDYRQ
jgi:hypothetical protein